MTEFLSVENTLKITTKFTEVFDKDGKLKPCNITDFDSFDKVVHLGYSSFYKDHLFAAYAPSNQVFIYKGVKGDEF